MQKDLVQMDVVESIATHQENDAKPSEDASQKASPTIETNGSTTDSPKHSTRQKRGQRRSRSRTPQKKVDDSKVLHITLKKLDSELNGKEVQEEPGTTNEKESADKNEIDKAKKQNGSNEEELTIDNEAQKNEKAKKHENKKDNSQDKKDTKKVESPKKESSKKDKKENSKQESSSDTPGQDTETVEMDPLVISDEPDPELQFDENSEGESGKGSPVIPRSLTRRSQTRNIPTPKTPKSVDQDADSEKNSVTHNSMADFVDNEVELPKTSTLNISYESSDTLNSSTKVEVGSDVTRMDYMEHHNSNFEDSSYINASREKSLSETLRGLSARRSIRPLNDYRTRLLRSNQEKYDLNVSEHSRSGLKRKSRSSTPEDRKKFKGDSSGSNSLFSSPFSNIRNKFKSDMPTSTPKLVSYRDPKNRLHYDEDFETGDDEKKSWCSIM